jgi:hypothetical protein
MIGRNIGNRFLQSVWADRTADGNGRRFIIVSVLTRVLKSGAPICLRIPSERVSFSGRATGHTVARCSKRVFGDRGLGGRATPVTRERGPYRARGNAAPVTRERGPYRLGVMPGRVTRERDPAALGVMPRRSRGSVTLPCSGSCHAGHAGAWTLPRSGSCHAGHAGA